MGGVIGCLPGLYLLLIGFISAAAIVGGVIGGLAGLLLIVDRIYIQQLRL